MFQLAQLDTNVSSGEIDLDPPQVDHIPIASGVAGTPQSLSVKAADVQGIASVTLLYRGNPDGEFKRILMRQVSGTDNFTVSIDSGIDQNLIEYYFLVIDTGGNKVLNGFPYEPFSRVLTPDSQLTEQAVTPGQPQDAAAPADSDSRLAVPVVTDVAADSNKAEAGQTKTLLWVVLGVLALGALASGSGGGDGGGTVSPGGAGDSQTVPVILNVPLPD